MTWKKTEDNLFSGSNDFSLDQSIYSRLKSNFDTFLNNRKQTQIINYPSYTTETTGSDFTKQQYYTFSTPPWEWRCINIPTRLAYGCKSVTVRLRIKVNNEKMHSFFEVNNLVENNDSIMERLIDQNRALSFTVGGVKNIPDTITNLSGSGDETTPNQYYIINNSGSFQDVVLKYTLSPSQKNTLTQNSPGYSPFESDRRFLKNISIYFTSEMVSTPSTNFTASYRIEPYELTENSLFTSNDAVEYPHSVCIQQTRNGQPIDVVGELGDLRQYRYMMRTGPNLRITGSQGSNSYNKSHIIYPPIRFLGNVGTSDGWNVHKVSNANVKSISITQDLEEL